MRRLTFGMNLSLDGYIAAPATTSAGACRATSGSSGGPIGWGATGLALYGRKLTGQLLIQLGRHHPAPARPPSSACSHRWAGLLLRGDVHDVVVTRDGQCPTQAGPGPDRSRGEIRNKPCRGRTVSFTSLLCVKRLVVEVFSGSVSQS